MSIKEKTKQAVSSDGGYTRRMALSLGDPAPDFSLPDQNGTLHSLADERGHPVLLYFYPEDDTPGCTVEACGIRDHMTNFQDAGCAVFGVSPDTVESHKAFAGKFSLRFPLLADTDKTVGTAYGTWTFKEHRQAFGIVRWSFLIDKDGSIAKIYPNVKPEEHAEMVLKDIRALR